MKFFEKIFTQKKSESQKHTKTDINFFVTLFLCAASFITVYNAFLIYKSILPDADYTLENNQLRNAMTPKDVQIFEKNYLLLEMLDKSAANAKETLLFSPVASADMSSFDDENHRAIDSIPPSLSIKAIIFQGSNAVCTLDISGEEEGGCYTVGSTFGSGNGKITGIDSKGVNWKWADRSYRTNL